jgi:hypothetical protein
MCRFARFQNPAVGVSGARITVKTGKTEDSALAIAHSRVLKTSTARWLGWQKVPSVNAEEYASWLAPKATSRGSADQY